MFCGHWHHYLITYFSLVCAVVDTISDELYQPQNLSVSWNTNDFSVTAQWSGPTGVDVGCTLQYTVELYSMTCPPVESSYIRDWPTGDLNYTWNLSEANDAKCIALLTKCENQTQNQTRLYEDISQSQVKNISCSYYAKEKMNCTWDLGSNTSDLLFSYGDKSDSLKPCAVYIGNGSKTTGCHLYGEDFLSYVCLYMHFHGEHEGRSFQNIFLINPRDSVTSKPPKLTIIRDKDHLVFQSNRPDFKEHCWVYTFRVNKCNKVDMHKGNKESNWSVRVPYDEACKYTVQVQANYKNCGTGQSDWSEPTSYGTNNDPNWLLKTILILIPVIISVCFIVAIKLFQRYKDKIFPKIPEPSLLCRDMLNAKTEGKIKDLYVHQLYKPPEERFEQKIQLELDAELLDVKT